MSSPQPPPEGIYVPVPTFFQPRSSPAYDDVTSPVDVETQGAHAVYLAKAGITGLVVLGSTGEAIHLTDKERTTVLAGVRRALDDAGFPSYPIIAGTATQNIEDTVAQLTAAKAAGSDWGLVLVPGYFAAATTQEGIVRWFTAVADRSPIPIMIYHYPGVSNNVQVAPSTYVTLAQHPNIVGCKLSHGDVSALTQIAATPAIDAAGFRTFTGLGQQLLPVVSVGAAGAIDGCAGFFPRTVVRLHAAARAAAPTADARRLQCRVSAMEDFVARFGTVGIKEAVSRLRGFGDRDGTRLPLCGGIPGGDAEWAKWAPIVEAMEEEEKRDA